MKKLILLILLTNTLFSDVYLDNNTKLMWQDNQDVAFVKLTWSEAAVYCKKSDVGDYHDWRLPTVAELVTIVNYSLYEPALSPRISYIVNTKNDFYSTYWTSTETTTTKYMAWSIGFKRGSIDLSSKSDSYNIRCVRNTR